MTHFAQMLHFQLQLIYSCMLVKFASNGFCKCVQMLKKQSIFSVPGMRNVWSSRISAILDITIEDDEGVSPYVCNKCTRRLSL